MEFFSGKSESEDQPDQEPEAGSQPDPNPEPATEAAEEKDPRTQTQPETGSEPEPEPAPTTEESGSRLKKLLHTMVKGIVDNPQGIQIQELSGEASIFFEMRVHDDDVGKVIGRNGRIINSMRTILKAAGGRDDRQVELKLLSDD